MIKQIFFQKFLVIFFFKFSKAISIFPECEEAWIGRGKIKIIKKNFEDALSDFEAVIKFKKDNPKGIFNIYKRLCLYILGIL